MGEKQSKGYWQEDEDAPACNGCGCVFSTTVRRHHCRNCGYVLCGDCSRHRAAIPMRGITEPERVCDACYLALRNSNMAGSSLSKGGMVPIVNPSEAANRPAAWAAGGTAGGPSADPRMSDAAGVAAEAQPSSTAPELTEEQRKAEEYYHNLYGGGAGDHGDNDAAGTAGTHQGTISPEALEKELLIQRWNTVRQATVYVDILVQQSERVEPDTAVEYSRETEALTLEPELPINQLGTRMLPLPPPTTDSARYLVEPVTIIGMPSTTLEKVAADLKQRLATRMPTHALTREPADNFVGY
ncbi:FYVE zinc finger family protein [Leishmania donovani]|uniref:FYVE zinc finger family protein n=3 Tax=Leishmania donovani TaxID=5661 RepID=A0A504X8A0_LEIDO|nr:FYVE zinc finger family protein [Leishmania donovani]